VPGWLRERWGVRAAAALSAAVFVGISLAGAGVALVVLQERSVRASVEEVVRARAVAAADRLLTGESPTAAVSAESSGFAVLQVIDANGSVLAASPQLIGVPPLPAGQVDPPDVAGQPDQPLVEDEPLLVVAQPAHTAAGLRVVLAGGSLVAARRSTQTVTELALIGVPLLALIAGAVTYAFSGAALRPVEAMRAQVAGLTDGDLSRRVPEPYARDEVGRLARTMNSMLERLEAAKDAQRRFVADASHELRSPLATITARLELGERRGPAPEDVAVMTSEASRMTRIIEDLLLLARADERGLLSRRADVDLDDLVEGEAARLHGADQLQVRVQTVPVRVTGDRAQLSRALRNLVDNAVRHATGQVWLRLWAEGKEAVIEVVDDGPGVPAEQRLRVFERFVRLDEARDREAGGAGLGLAIVAQVVAAHGGSVEALPAGDRGALLRVLLPLQRDAGPTPRA
jgi:signal transduction histidine kinase